MKRFLQCFAKWLAVLLAVFHTGSILAQSATVSYPFAVGKNVTCPTSGDGSTSQMHFYTYNGSTNSISAITSTTVGSPVRRYTPELRIGSTGGGGGAQRFTSSVASVSFNPKDHKIYYLWTAYGTGNSLTQGVAARTFAWSWTAGTQPLTTSPRLDTVRSFASDILGVAFDNDGNGYIIEFTDALPTTPATYKAMIRSINFSTGALGVADTLDLTGGAKIYAQGSGDVVMTPSGQMFFIVDNKLFTPNYKAYTGTASKITCTYVDTVVNAATGNYVGLTYAEGETVSAYSGGGCPFYETNMLTAATTAITKTSTVYSASDMATVVSGIGVAKKLISATPTGTAKQYDVVYEIYVKNYGNVDITNVQVTDDLTLINGTANVSNVSTAFVGTPPTGITGNALFNGNTVKNLLTGTGTLPNYPVSSSSFTIRVSCRVSNIETGKLYYNSAVGTAIGFNNQSLKDSSTNGSSPDLNANDKPDDLGESEPTPLLISITPQTPPCTTLGQVFFSETFGTGATASSLSTGTSQYTGSATQPLGIDKFMLASNALDGDNSKFISLTDHTSGTGRMMIVNADATSKVIYSGQLGSLCAGQQYSLSFYAAFIGNSSYQTICDGFGGFKYPKIKMRVKDQVTGLVITEISTADITATTWTQYGMKWVMPSGYSNIVFELINDAPGGCGNDLALDDIQMGTCDAAPTVSVSGNTIGCLSSSTSMSANISDASVIPGTKEYQWQVSADGTTGWSNIAAATAATYTISSVTASEVNKYYRVLVAAQGNINSTTCRYTSAAFLLSAKTPSTAPTGATVSANNTCPGEVITLTVQGGTLGTNAQYKWYSATCGGTLVGSGPTITVSPTATTTYYVRVEGDCNTTTCVSVTVTINCDIDKDDDGIPDSVEGVADTDGDGIANYLDLDSDNDGIPDVVESGGVDASGDGKIDNYTDTDDDGLSDNVDASLTGYVGSGTGLGAIDTDGDGVPNYLDLDSDNDGVPDLVEVYGVDANNDGRVDSFSDTNNDGFSENVSGSAKALLKTGADTDNNGRADSYPNKNIDGDAKANPYDLDSDGDGVTDVVEAGFADSDYNGQMDGSLTNGWSTTVRSMSSLTLPNRDGTGKANMYDIDSDDDGIPDNIEGLPTNSYVMPTGLDTDEDGIDNAYDNSNGFGGNGTNPVNTDGDAYPDYLDNDSDGDGLLDIVEGNDLNGNGVADDDVSLTGTDTDGDGLDDRFDSDNTTSKGTSRFMGNNGNGVGPNTAGSKSTLHKASAGASDRAWRTVNAVLDIRFIHITVKRQSTGAKLLWRVVSQQGTKYTIEKSNDGVYFELLQAGGLAISDNQEEAFEVIDRSAVAIAKRYYRIKATAPNGKVTYSTTVIITQEPTTLLSLKLFPNPAHQFIKLNVESEEAATAQFTIQDMQGKQIAIFNKAVTPGLNSFTQPLPPAILPGTYMMRVLISGNYTTYKFEVQR